MASETAVQEVVSSRMEHGARWIETVMLDAVRHYAWGVGDDNPLWLRALAPPCLLYAVHAGEASDPLRAGDAVAWKWFDAIAHGDRLRAAVTAPGTVEYRTHRDALVATLTTRPAVSDDRAGDPAPYRYELEELHAIDRAVLAERRRGDRPRCWEDVAVGDRLPAVVKGPLSVIDIVAWYAGAQGAHLRAPDGAELAALGTAALPQQRVAWAQHLLTNWIGDAGFLHTCDVRLRGPVHVGDTTWWSGRVGAVSPRGAAGLVEVAIAATNQRGETTAEGVASALLPGHDGGAVPLPIGRPDALG